MATNTATSFTNHTAPSSGSTAGPYAISFNYLEQSDVDVTVDGVLQTLSVAYTFTSGTQITFTSGNEPTNGAAIVIKRDTNTVAAPASTLCAASRGVPSGKNNILLSVD